MERLVFITLSALDFLKPLKLKICFEVLYKGPDNRQINKTPDSQSGASGRDAMDLNIVNVSLDFIISLSEWKEVYFFLLLLVIFMKDPR